jgi:hypothetical protein
MSSPILPLSHPTLRPERRNFSVHQAYRSTSDDPIVECRGALRNGRIATTGASHQQIARALFGDERVAKEWHSTSDAMKSTVRRLVRLANRLAAGEYRNLMLTDALRRSVNSE